MQYFKLHVFCKYINGHNSGCIYNMKNHEMISISNPLNTVLAKAQRNEPLYESESLKLKELEEKGLGEFYETPVYVESFQYGPNPAIKTMISPNYYIKRCYIQVTNECALRCKFCEADNTVNRRTGCKKWNNIDAKISLEEWKSIFVQLKKLGCDEICFIGGDPFLYFDKLSKIVEIAVNEGIINFSVYSHKIDINDDILGFLQKYKFIFIGTVITYQNETFEKITGQRKEMGHLWEDIERLINNKIRFIGNIVVGNFNEDEIEKITNDFVERHIPFKYNIIYNRPWNHFFSKKYVSKMYDKENDFGFVTKESISFLNEYNSCLYGQIYINLAGDISPCPMMNTYIVGNIRDEGGIVAAVGTEAYQKVAQMNRNRIEGCKDCSYRLNCFDCRAIEFMATNKIDNQEYCKFFKAGETVE